MERDGRGHPSFSCPPPLGGWVASGARRKGASIFFLPTPTQGVGGERSETEGGVSAMVNDGGCPFMFDGTLSFDRVLMPASQASTAWSGHPFHCAHPAEDVQVSQSWRLACPLRRSPFIWLTVYAVPLSPRWEANLRQRTGFSCSFIQPLHKVFKGHHGLALPVPA